MVQEIVTGDQPSDTTVEAAPVRRRDRLRSGGSAGWGRTAAAVAAGLLMFLAFPPNLLSDAAGSTGIWPLAPVGVAVFTLAVRGVRARTGAWLGLLTGLSFFLVLLDWVRVIGPDAWAGLSLTEAAYFAPLGAGVAVVGRLRGWPLWTAALWVSEEFVRGRWPFGGLPWGRLAFSQTASPLTPYSALGGAPLVSFVTALIGALLALALLRARGRKIKGGARMAGLALAAAAVAGVGGLLVPVPDTGRQVTVAVIQGNVPRLGLDFLGQRKAVLDNHIRRTRELAAQIRAGKVPKPELVVWPENSSDLDPYTNDDARQSIDDVVKEIGVPVLVGAVVTAPDGHNVQNRGIVWDPRTGPGTYYTKRHPVPFGEYVPFRSVLQKLITRFDRVPSDFLPGTWPGLLQLGPVRIGDVICFEVAYDGIVRDVADAQMLVVQTNNATYGHTSLPWQQLAMSRLRAVEHGRTVLVAATSGISAIVEPDGRVRTQSGEFVPDIQVARVPARTARTIADRVGPLAEWALALLGIGAVAVAFRNNRREGA
ncbi:MAG: apolipoprotein N-acyltransferase [Actinomycetia bacterium]|nr:apolipoprotein N-acyltransferase [Actinomycetes bacterium]